MSGATASARAELEAWLASTRAWSEALLARRLSEARWPARLHEAARYALLGGGKHLRPALVRLACEHHGGSERQAQAPALAVELVHTYSLVHDDLPCMDDDDLRRGRPTCHKVYGQALAILVGDALLTEAFAVLAGEPRAGELAAALARAAGGAGMVGGQVIDLEAAPAGLDAAHVAGIHAAKTAALLGASVELGALAAGADEQRARDARAFGLALGLAFQATDDILDVTGDAATLGKTPGKDARAAKPTLVAALGLAGARAEARRLGAEARRAADRLAQPSPARFHALVELVLDRSA